MIFLKEFPPNYREICKAFPAVLKNKHVIFTYGEACFNPYGGHMDEPLCLHEATHSLQQSEMGSGERGPRRWWAKYIADPQFRFEQELEAYRNQYRRYCELHTDRNKRATFLLSIASDLSSAQYGNCVGRAEAFKLIREHAEVR